MQHARQRRVHRDRRVEPAPSVRAFMTVTTSAAVSPASSTPSPSHDRRPSCSRTPPMTALGADVEALRHAHEVRSRIAAARSRTYPRRAGRTPRPSRADRPRLPRDRPGSRRVVVRPRRDGRREDRVALLGVGGVDRRHLQPGDDVVGHLRGGRPRTTAPARAPSAARCRPPRASSPRPRRRCAPRSSGRRAASVDRRQRLAVRDVLERQRVLGEVDRVRHAADAEVRDVRIAGLRRRRSMPAYTPSRLSPSRDIMWMATKSPQPSLCAPHCCVPQSASRWCR